MKLRIQGNAIRIRLTQTEVAAIAQGQTVLQTTNFPGSGKLVSCVQASAEIAILSASFHASTLSIRLPLELAHPWAVSEEVSLHGEQLLEDGTLLSLLIEKDFACLHQREENADTFPNPRAQNPE